jgi:hypothetical protein
MESKVDLILIKLKTMDLLETQIREQRDQINGLSFKIDTLQQTNESLIKLQTDVNELKSEVSVANSEITTLKAEVEFLHRQRTERQIIINNVPHRQQENLSSIIQSILGTLNCDPQRLFPVDAYRLGKYDDSRERPPAILVEFGSTFVRNTVMSHWRTKKMMFSDEICPSRNNFGCDPADRIQIFINKNYSPAIKALLAEARKLKKHGFKIVYEYANIVYVRRSLADNDEPIKILNKDTVAQLMK